MAINRRMNNRNLEPRTDCHSMCEHLLTNEYGGYCMSGLYQCGVGPGGGCNCDNMGPVGWGGFMNLCSYSCTNYNMGNNYMSCMAGCGSASGGGPYYIGPSSPRDDRIRRGSNFRSGGRVRRFARGGNVRNQCPHGYTMIGGVCR